MKMHLWTNLVVFYIISVRECLGEILFKSPKGTMESFPELSELAMSCENQENQDLRMTDVFPPLNISLPLLIVTIYQCLPINTTYVDEFIALNIDTTTETYLNLKFNLDRPLPPGNYTEGLTIKYVVITNVNKFVNIFKYNQHFLEPMFNLFGLAIITAEIPPLPDTIRVNLLALVNEASITDWGNCKHLEKISLITENFNSVNKYTKQQLPVWPQNCTRLEHLSIYHLKSRAAMIVVERMIAAAPNLRTLEITNCQLDNLPIAFIQSARNLILLDLSNNNLEIDFFESFPFPETLKTLDLSGSDIKVDSIISVVTKLPALVNLRLQGANFACTKPMLEAISNSSLEFLDLSLSRTFENCFEKIRFRNLRHLNARETLKSKRLFKLLDLPQTDAGNLEVNFDVDDIKVISFDIADYETLRQENLSSPFTGRILTVTVKNGYVSCDCEHGWLARALHDFPHIISIPDLRCDRNDGNLILKESKNHLECNRTKQNGCLYKENWRDGTVTAECNKEAWIKMDHMYTLSGLNVSGQEISTLHSNLTETIQWLDLRRNHISKASAEETAALFAAGRRVWLADNSLLCDCDNRALLDAILLHKEQVQDYGLLKCVGTEEPLSSISTAVLCNVALTVSLAVSGVLIVLAGITAMLLRRYGELLRMFLYSRGWCMSCLEREDLDDKPYDAFISFAHEDREYVTETLLPGLEDAPEKFRICVHHRDWAVGDWIPAQIMRSVQLSKCTLIVLSRNFITSSWSTLEFRYAMANADEDPNAKILILIKDDVLDMKFSMELRRYLTYNTYLRCDDEWFWQKLRYAMPHRVRTKASSTEDIDMGITINEINMRAPVVVTSVDNAIAIPNLANGLLEESESPTLQT